MGTLHVNDLVVEYSSGGYAVRPIDGLNLEVSAGSLALLLGPSGCGKTTLLSCLGGILRPTSGRIALGDLDVTTLDPRALTTYRRRTVGIVFQAFNLLPSLTAFENVMVPMDAAGVSRREARQRAEELLARVGLQDRMRHRPGDLSGGQQHPDAAEGEGPVREDRVERQRSGAVVPGDDPCTKTRKPTVATIWLAVSAAARCRPTTSRPHPRRGANTSVATAKAIGQGQPWTARSSYKTERARGGDRAVAQVEDAGGLVGQHETRGDEPVERARGDPGDEEGQVGRHRLPEADAARRVPPSSTKGTGCLPCTRAQLGRW